MLPPAIDASSTTSGSARDVNADAATVADAVRVRRATPTVALRGCIEAVMAAG
jgi:hypothetical protein